ncbi:MAG: Na+/H+ antiporter NhaA [Hyphomonadaceae bacterium]|nr:Na+/H+ antiporter NhaA [Hyphomonadaceae bacterium]
MMASSGGAKHWWEKEITPSILLILATLASFVLQNSGAREAFATFLHQPIGAEIGPFNLRMDVGHFVADGLMAIFFLYVGLELKRETIEGPFRNRDEALMPAIAAVGGMIAPAAIYVAVTGAVEPYLRGWAIPAATDIAFAMGALSLLGARVPANLRLFLLALAIIDDVGAILIIALFYSNDIAGWALGGAVITFLAMMLLNRAGLKRLGLYWLLGLVLWAFTLASGLHATLAGVLTALAIPMRASKDRSPLIAAEHELKPWVLLLVMPVFALANAGAPLDGLDLGALAHPVTLGVTLGLALGKPVGIYGGVWLATRVFKLPSPAQASNLLGVAMIAGIGFTMSLFIGSLAFGEGPMAAPTRLGVLIGSLLAGAAGVAVLARTLPNTARDRAAE